MAYLGTAKSLFSSLMYYAHLRFPCLFYTHLVLFPCLFCICGIRMFLYYLSLIIQLYTYQNNAERLRKESEYGENEMQYHMFFFFFAYVLRAVMGGLYIV